MAVVNNLAALMPDLNAAKPSKAPVTINHGVLRTSCFVAAVTAGDSPESTYEVARLPSHARIHNLSKLHSTGITGLTDVDLGVSDNPDCLADGVNLTATATSDAAPAITPALISEPLWKLAGLAKDPQKEMSVFLMLKTAATADGSVAVDLVYITE
ncbi:hypothetical protein [uncultured Ruegeria sp.]|uniref:hypothetical protein n=1 Tax=uncultured Ruegeria sp. TaxID=259304 RepID=UPI0026222D75|nr:hypothetical protein [uncultured Ruegeria sp.]